MKKLRRLSIGVGLALTLLGAAPLALPALAQQTSGASQPDLVPVMVWTFVVALFFAGVLSLGYLYRRAHGAQDEVIPKTVDPYYRQEGHAEEHSAAELHPEMAHDAVGMHADQPAEPGAHGRELTAPTPNGPVAASRSASATAGEIVSAGESGALPHAEQH